MATIIILQYLTYVLINRQTVPIRALIFYKLDDIHSLFKQYSVIQKLVLTVNINHYYSTIMSFHHIRSREHAKYATVLTS